jgi:choice-of-anchor B domain-containing protein
LGRFNSIFSISLCLILLIPVLLFGQDHYNVELLDNWQDSSLVSNSSEAKYNDCWGYEQNGIEYALVGSTEGIHFLKINDDATLTEVDFVRGKFSSMSVVHRDMKVFKNYLYAVCDEGASSLQVIDLSYLPDSAHVVMENDSSFARVHNLFFDEENELMYVCAVTPNVSGIPQALISMQVYSVTNPILPVLLFTGPNDINEVHDAFVRNNIAYLNCGFDGLRVYDFSIPNSPIFLQNLNIYQDQGYNHQGWLSPDGNNYVFADETNGKRLKRCEVSNDNTVSIENKFGTDFIFNSVPHNLMVSDNFVFCAYYNLGLRIYNLNSPTLEEVAHYDTYPEEVSFQGNGAWGVYSELPSERIIVSDRHHGLFLFDFNRAIQQTNNDASIGVYPNPTIPGSEITIKLKETNIPFFQLSVTDLKGKIVFSDYFQNQNFGVVKLNLSRGVYTIEVIYFNKLGDIIQENKKIAIQ